MNWGTLLADIRNDLQDTASTPRWSDAQLFTYTKDAILDYSQYLPRRLDQFQLALVGSGYPLPLDYVESIFVESPAGTYLEERQERPAVKFPQRTRLVTYYIDGGNLYLNTPTSDPVLLTYFTNHTIPASAADNTFILSIPDGDEELLRLYVKHKAYVQTRGRQSNLDRFKMNGARDDNPLAPETDELLNEYHSKLALRCRGGFIRLYRRAR